MARCVDYLDIQTATLVQGTSATITCVPTALENDDRYLLRYYVKWTDAIGNESLLISVGGTVYPVLNKRGNPVTIGKLRRRELLYLTFSNITSATPAVTPHFTCGNEMCPQIIHTPPITA